MADFGICTIVSKNYLPFARVLVDSFYEHNEGEAFVLLVDSVDGYFKPNDEKFRLIEIEELRDEIPDFERFCFQYTILELNTAVKPYLLGHLLKKYGLKKLIYFDPDILITNSVRPIVDLLDAHSFVLTPHLTAPINDTHKPSEVDILLSGSYNLGFFALSRDETTSSMLSWWQKRLYSNCIHAVEKGIFVDQKWIDLVPGMYHGVFILREPGYNVAYWNYHCRDVKVDGGRITVNGQPSYFFHFSGLDPENMEPVSKHQDRYRIGMLKEDLQAVFRIYRDRIMTRGFKDCRNWPYLFGSFQNGERIPDLARRLYLSMGEAVKRFGNPFATGEKSYFAWLNEKIDGNSPAITRLMREMYYIRHDVQRVYPDISGADREGFVAWALTSGKREYQLGEKFFQDVVPAVTDNTELSRQVLFLSSANKGKEFLKKTAYTLFGKNPKIITNLKKINKKLNAALSIPANTDIRATMNSVRDTGETGINIAGYITSESGTGEAVRSDIRIIKTLNIPYALNNVPSSSRQSDSTFTSFTDAHPYPINLIHVNADQVPVFHSQKGDSYFRDAYNIGYWVWELSVFPEEWRPHFSYFDEIWTASTFCMESIGSVSPVPVIRVPHCVSIDTLKDLDRRHFGLDPDSFIFLFMFDFLSFFERKNPLVLLEAFREAFPSNSDALLVLKCSNSYWNPAFMTDLLRASKGLNVRIVDKYLVKDELHSLMSLSDCYVSLHRSEGFGLTLAESMYMGKPVIATAYSGNMDFMTVNNSFPVKYTLIEIEKDTGPYKKGNVWADPDIGHAAEMMDFVYRNREIAAQIGQTASRDIRTLYSPSAIGRRAKERIDLAMGKR
ncbi:MAG TPA: glycosyltransferase family 4 protein [Thermodesulfovibrionales bacterium]|nr:glycosyltransferase family 4 protein [Thermodesulfovibrionales bacterium]